MYVWGRNNNHLFKQNHKKTYSLPQKVPIRQDINKCAPGYDYIFILTQSTGLLCYYESAFYQVSQFSQAVDVATTDNMVVVVNKDGQAWIMEFNAEKIISGQLTPTKIRVEESVSKVYMNYSDIFLQTTSGSVYHLKRNEWYETKTYSDPIKIVQLSQDIICIAPGHSNNYFLTNQGDLFMSDKNTPTQVYSPNLSLKLTSIAAADYFMGIAANGRLYIWGKYNEESYSVPSQFGRLTQKFVSVSVSSQNGYGVTEDGECWIWGKNANGELGVSDYQPRVKPYPLITMEGEKLKEVYIGEGYTVCTVEIGATEQKKQRNQNIKLNINMKKMNRHSQNHEQQSPNYIKSKNPSKKEKKSLPEEFSSVNLCKPSPKRIEVNKAANTQVMRPPHRKNKTTQRTPQHHQAEKSNRSISPISNQQRSKSHLSKANKSPYLEHVKSTSHSHLKKQKKELLNHTTALDAHLKTISEYKQVTEALSQQNQKLKNLLISQEETTNSQLNTLSQENSKLKRVLDIKQNIISDITTKIQLLEQAIEQHEITLTARSSKMDEYQRREKEYEVHIDQLEKNIQTLIKGKQEGLPSQEHLYTDMYNNLKLDYNKEKDYFMNRMGDYENQLKKERADYRGKIRQLQEEVTTFRSLSDRENKENYQVAGLCGPLKESGIEGSKVQNQFQNQRKPLEQSDTRLNFIISRIEDSKIRIAKSSTKLYQMIEEN